MANTLSKTGITDNSTIRVWHVTQSIDAFTGEEAYDITLSGSLEIQGPTNLTLPVTGTLITNTSYATTSSYSLNGLTASNTSYAGISKDTFFLQLHHGTFQTPISESSYYFSVNPLKGTGDSLSTSSAYVGTNYPTSFRIVSASISSTVNGIKVTGSNHDPLYTLWVSGDRYIFTTPPNLSSSIFSFVEEVNLEYNGHDIYMQWDTGGWTTAPTNVSHNVVLYCDRGYNPT